jgi:putative DNA primase/helicase
VDNARFLVRRHGRVFLWVEALRHWMAFDSRRWRIDDDGAMMRAAKATAMVRASQSRSRLEAMTVLARSEPGMAARPEDFDRDPLLLNLDNGTLDLRTVTLRPHDPADKITKLAPVVFDPDARCPGFLAFVDWLTCGDCQRARYLQRALGYSLTGLTREQVLFIAHGLGRNGKSTLFTVLLRLLGEYATTAQSRVFLAAGSDDHPTGLADLAGRRVVWLSEIGEGQRLDESLVKQATGSDPIKARRMREDFWQFVPQFKLWLPCNDRPEIRGVGLAIWRRLRVIPFTATIGEDKIDRALPDKLLAEAPGILNWLVTGCLAWQSDGLGTCTAVEQATAAYRLDMDELGDFLASRTIRADDDYAEFGALYRAYLSWAGPAGVDRKLSKRAFGLNIAARGFRKQESNGATKYWGLKLRDESSITAEVERSDSTNERSSSVVDELVI